MDKVDWKDFLARHDMLWKRLPDRFENAVYTGNGQLGAMLFSKDGGQSLHWQMGRSDVNFSGQRIPIGDLVLKPQGKITGTDIRLDLWNAEATGTLNTDKGEIRFRSFTHTDQMVNVFEVTVEGAEQAAWSWSPAWPATRARYTKRKRSGRMT